MEDQPMNMAVAYQSLTVPQLKQMLDARHVEHRRELEETRAKWAAEVSALREAFSQAREKWTLELHMQRNVNSDLRRELDAVYAELEKANSVIVDQGRKLTAHSEVAELEKRLQIARRIAS
jgi:hypothetical protein